MDLYGFCSLESSNGGQSDLPIAQESWVSMHPSLPNGVRSWLAQAGWLVIQDKPLIGGFAASIFRLRVRQESGEEIDLIYKQFTPDRANEGELYTGVMRDLSDYAPRLFAHIHDGEEQGILLADAGRPLKSVLKTTMAGDASQLTMLNNATQWLAEFHVSFEGRSLVWLKSGQLEKYSMDSSQFWGTEAIQHLNWLIEQGFHGVERSTVIEVQDMVNRFYLEYPKWLNGRTTITHGDPHLENLLLQDGRFSLIDWEYTCVTVPQRDLSILLQDVLDETIHHDCRKTYWDYLRQYGWSVDDESFETTYQACFFDNTLMMLGWEIYKFRQGFLSRMELECIVATKITWLYESFQHLSKHPRLLGVIGDPKEII